MKWIVAGLRWYCDYGGNFALIIFLQVHLKALSLTFVIIFSLLNQHSAASSLKVKNCWNSQRQTEIRLNYDDTPINEMLHFIHYLYLNKFHKFTKNNSVLTRFFNRHTFFFLALWLIHYNLKKQNKQILWTLPPVKNPQKFYEESEITNTRTYALSLSSPWIVVYL